MYEYLTQKEIDERYPKDDQTFYDNAMCVGWREENNCFMYLDFGNFEEKTKIKQLNNLCTEFIETLDNIVSYKYNNNIPIDMEIPDDYREDVKTAVELKRHGNYFEALKIYNKILKEAGPSEALCIGAYKIIACAGIMGYATILLFTATGIAKMNNNTYYYQNDILHQQDLILPTNPDGNKMDLINYLKSLSGNLNYECKMPFEFMKAEIIRIVKLHIN